jgi:hypothetical protein
MTMKTTGYEKLRVLLFIYSEYIYWNKFLFIIYS